MISGNPACLTEVYFRPDVFILILKLMMIVCFWTQRAKF